MRLITLYIYIYASFISGTHQVDPHVGKGPPKQVAPEVVAEHQQGTPQSLPFPWPEGGWSRIGKVYFFRTQIISSEIFFKFFFSRETL